MNHLHEQRLHSITTLLQAAGSSLGDQRGSSPQSCPPARYVTISRQAGAGGKSLGDELVKAINRLKPEAELWCAWDNELVNKVAGEHHIGRKFIEALEDADHRWINEFVASLSPADDPSEFKVFRRVAMTIRALAGAGRAVIVGRGGVFITAGLPGGIHVRLVAPIDFRVGRMAERLHGSLEDAAVKVREIDRNRSAFYHRYWPSKNVTPETFTLTFNTEELTEPQMVACLLPIVLCEQVGEQPSTRLQPEGSFARGRQTGEQRGGAL